MHGLAIAIYLLGAATGGPRSPCQPMLSEPNFVLGLASD
jgi:hypothetical protein